MARWMKITGITAAVCCLFGVAAVAFCQSFDMLHIFGQIIALGTEEITVAVGSLYMPSKGEQIPPQEELPDMMITLTGEEMTFSVSGLDVNQFAVEDYVKISYYAQKEILHAKQASIVINIPIG